MLCEYGHYNRNQTDLQQFLCNFSNERCPYAKLCMNPNVRKYIATNAMEKCPTRVRHIDRNIPQGSYYVVRKAHGLLYVELSDDKTITIKNTFGDKVTNYIYLKQSDNGYEASLMPFEER